MAHKRHLISTEIFVRSARSRFDKKPFDFKNETVCALNDWCHNKMRWRKSVHWKLRKTIEGRIRGGEETPQTKQAMHVQRNIEARECNHCCCGQSISITYCERVSVVTNNFVYYTYSPTQLWFLLYAYVPTKLHLNLLYSTATTRLGRARSNINTKHKYNRHATTNPISLSSVTEVKGEKNICLRMVKNWPKHVGEF